MLPPGTHINVSSEGKYAEVAAHEDNDCVDDYEDKGLHATRESIDPRSRFHECQLYRV